MVVLLRLAYRYQKLTVVVERQHGFFFFPRDVTSTMKNKDVFLTMDEHEATMSKLWQQHNFTPKIMFKSHTMEALRSMVANDMSVAILSDMVYRSWSLEGRPIVKKDLIENISSMNTGMTWPWGRKLSEAALTFIAFLRTEIVTGSE